MKDSLSRFAPLAFWALLLTPAFAQENALKQPPLADAPARETQGLTLSFSAGGKTDTRGARLVALYVPAGQPASPFLAVGSFAAKWEGAITSELRAQVAFSAEVRGSMKVSLNDAVILEGTAKTTGKPVQLNKGSNKLVVEFQTPEKGDAILRLLWSSKEFPWEPVPPTVFKHDASAKELRAGERIREGRLLFAEHRCAACHEAGSVFPPKGEGMPELAHDASIFDAIGEKYQEHWMAAWINDPHSIRPNALMPKVFAGKPGEIDQRAADLAAFFASLNAPAEAKPLDEALVPQGGALFANLGCIACHTKPDADGQDEFTRVPLAHIRAKWHAPALTNFLKDPAKNYAWNRMPHFRLSDEEATQLTAYLFLTAKGEIPAGPKGDATRGGQLLATSNCLNCHAGVPPTTTPALVTTLQNGWDKGCLAANPAARGTAPDFGFTPAQRDALLAFAGGGLDSLKQDAFPEFAERQIKNLRCTACHARDGQQSVWSQLEEEIVALQSGAPLEEGEGKPIHTTALPDLTWIGEKLRPDYMATFIAGHAKDKPRPWIVARMPGFAAYAEPLAEGLAHGHGFHKPLPASPPDAEKVKAGETLIGENGGFNCIQCHTLGDRAATAVFEAPGPNLALTPLRLRAEYYHRWVLAPTRIDPETKMPRFADEEGKTPLADFFGGKADEQFDAIWQYLQTFQK